MKRKALMLNDGKASLSLVIGAARALGYELTIAETAEEYWRSYDPGGYDLVAFPLVNEHVEGIDNLRRLSASECSARIIAINDYAPLYSKVAERLSVTYPIDFVCLSSPLNVEGLSALISGDLPAAEMRKTVNGPDTVC